MRHAKKFLFTSPLVGEVDAQRRVRGAFNPSHNQNFNPVQNHMLDKFNKSLRQSQTDAETILWYHLRNRNLRSHKFRRQHSLEDYIVDFVCLSKKIIIELDGSQHIDRENYDKKRSNILESQGYTILRFWNNEVLENLGEVLEIIYEALGVKKAPLTRRR